MTVRKKVLLGVFVLIIGVIFLLFGLSFYRSYSENQAILLAQQAEEERIAQEEEQRLLAEQQEAARLESIKEQLATGNYNEDLKVAFLTFDDGPAENSNAVLDVLQQYDAKATFFTNGRNSEEANLIYQRIVNEGHTLGNHTWNHDYGNYYNLDSFLNDITSLDNYQEQVTGTETLKVFRFPGGSTMTNSTFTNAVRELGYNYYDWDASAGDGASVTLDPTTTVMKILTEIEGVQTPIILMHAENPAKSTSLEALPSLILELRKAGYELLPLDSSYNLRQFVS